MLINGWSRPPNYLPMLGPDVHLWRIDMSRWRPFALTLRLLLSSDEHARADRFRFDADADRLIIGRGVLRLLMGRLLQVPPRHIAFSYSATGKPSIGGVEFNVTHSGDIILIATHRYRIGIDVEHVQRALDVESVWHDCFTARERALIAQSVNAHERFFQLWTRKEAWLKAIGAGLSFPLCHIDIADATAPLIARTATIDGSPPSRIVDLPVDPSHVAACAISGPDCQLHLWHLEETFFTARRIE